MNFKFIFVIISALPRGICQCGLGPSGQCPTFGQERKSLDTLQGWISFIFLQDSIFQNSLLSVRGDVKYYFADFVRNGGTPPHYGQFFWKRRSHGFGGYPPLYGLFPEIFLQKGLKIMFFA